MRISRLSACLAVLTCCAFAQFRSGSLQVRVVDETGRAVNRMLNVRLFSASSSSPIAEAYTNDAGMTEFHGVLQGNYHIGVVGEGFEETDSGPIEVDGRKGSQFAYITVHRSASQNPEASNFGRYAVSATSLRVPSGARKEYGKASQAIIKQDWPNAIEHLNRAVAIYPQYADAYNNLGVAYGRVGNKLLEKQSFEHAVQADDHFAPALRNLALLNIAEHNFLDSEARLLRAASADPSDVATLTLLCNVQLLLKKYDDAIGTAHKAHNMPNENALVHYVAARAFEHQSRFLDAVAECKTFLQEEPAGARAEAVRRELGMIQNYSASAK